MTYSWTLKGKTVKMRRTWMTKTSYKYHLSSTRLSTTMRKEKMKAIQRRVCPILNGAWRFSIMNYFACTATYTKTCKIPERRQCALLYARLHQTQCNTFVQAMLFTFSAPKDVTNEAFWVQGTTS